MPNEHRSSGRTASSLVEEEVAPCSGLRFRCGVAFSGKRAVRRHPPASSAGACSAWFGCTQVWRWDRQHSPACDGLPRAPRFPDLARTSMGTADHKLVAPVVIRPLQATLAILLRHAGYIALETPAQGVNVSPGSVLDRNCGLTKRAGRTRTFSGP